MKIYKVCYDFSDIYEQDHKEYGYYADKGKAIIKLEKVVDEASAEYDLVKISDEMYELEFVGLYTVDEIEVIE